jgi:PAS domain S-box-containing protein
LFAERFVDRVVIGLPGVSVQVVATLKEGFDHLDRGGTDLIVLDLGRGRVQDLAPLERLLERKDAPAAIVMAGYDDDGLALRAIRLGAQDFITRRDATSEVLARAIRYALERKHSQQQLVQAEAASRENLELFRIISENAGDLVALVDPDGTRIYENFAYARALGYTMEELKDHSPLDLLHPEDRGRIRATLKELFLRGTESTFQYGMRHKNGSWRQFEGRAAPVRGSARGKDLAIIVARDITERLRMDTEILRSHAVKNLILENSTLGIAYVSGRVFEWANTRWGEILGRPMNEILGASTRIAYPDEASFEDMGRTLYPTMLREEGSDMTWQLCRGDGTLFWCRMIGRPLDPEKPDQGSVWILEDITDRVNAEQERLSLEVQLRHAQKLEAIGQLAAGIAHEINTPTQYIGDNTKFLAEAFRDVFQLLDALEEALGAGPVPDSLRTLKAELDVGYLREEIPKALDQSLEGIARVTKIVKAMKDFSHPGSDHPMDVDLNQAIESTLTVSRNEWKYVADLELDLDPALPTVLCYANEVNQAILNLVVNAAHAIEDALAGTVGAKGTIRISTARAEDQVEIRIQDSGTGIPEHVRARIFDPFFTTKSVGKGTGQGLAIVHTVVVERHRGSVAFDTELGKGSVFILRIPIAGPPALT